MQVDIDTKKQVYGYNLFIQGIWGRNRKRKHELFKLAQDCETQLPLEEVMSLKEQKIAELKPKGAFKIKITEQPMTLDVDRGFITRSFMMFTDKTLHTEEVTC